MFKPMITSVIMLYITSRQVFGAQTWFWWSSAPMQHRRWWQISFPFNNYVDNEFKQNQNNATCWCKVIFLYEIGLFVKKSLHSRCFSPPSNRAMRNGWTSWCLCDRTACHLEQSLSFSFASDWINVPEIVDWEVKPGRCPLLTMWSVRCCG